MIKPLSLFSIFCLYNYPLEKKRVGLGKESYDIFVLRHWDLCRYLAAKSEADHYARELKREEEEIIAVPDTGS